MLVIIYIPAFIAVSLVMGKKASVAEKISDQPLLTVFIIIPVVSSISLLIIFLVSGGNLSIYGFIAISAGDLFSFLIIGLMVTLILQIIAEMVLKMAGTRSEPELLNENQKNRIILSLSMIILPSVGEELVFRGLIQTWVDIQEGINYQEGTLITPGVILGAILFAIIHLGLIGQKEKLEVTLIVIMAAIIGLCAGSMFALSGSIIPSMIIHAESNLTGVTFNLIKIKREDSFLAKYPRNINISSGDD
ncbi:MAG: lysostaphin resistance A-like protein [Candidatus Hodarchaeales archaeon]